MTVGAGGEGPSAAARRSRAVKAHARDLGFDMVGVTGPEPSHHIPFLRRWLDDGFHGEMSYLEGEDAVRRREDLRTTMEDVRSVVVVAHGHHLEDPPGVPEDPSRAVIARYARGRDYHKVVKGKLRRLLERMRQEMDRDVGGRAYVDTGPILERELARRAGLGWFGKNTMLLHPARGSHFFLGCLLLDVELEPDEPFAGGHCGTCTRCLEACPTGALLGYDEDGAPVMDARRCISYLTIEHRGPIPRELRPLMGNRVFGCDICQEVCPFNVRFAEETAEPGYAARGPGQGPAGVQPSGPGAWHPGTGSPSLVDLMSMDEAAWDSFSRGSALRRTGRSGFLRNVAVALGNWGSEEAAQVLASALEDPEALIRGHAAWALGRLGSDSARRALAAALASEREPFVREELADGLDSPGTS